MATLLDYKCPACGGALEFGIDVQKIKCPYCDTEYEVADLRQLDEALKEAPADDIHWDGGAQEPWEDGDIVSYICNSCGGQIIADENTAATHCPYCGNPVVIAGRLAGTLKPDLVIPFKLDKNAAVEALTRHLTGKRLLPKVFKDENRIQEVKGIYVPFWLFDADAQGSARYHGTKVRTWQDSRYIYMETSHYQILRGGGLSFQGIPVDGSSKMPNDMMESLEPYDLTQAVDFQTAYLAGYFADKYDVDSAAGQDRANTRIRSSLEKALASTVFGYATVVPQGSSMQLKKGSCRYALLPVWLLTTQYKDSTYLFAMNGQTGKFVGNLPMDWGAFWKWFLGVAAGVSAAAYAITLLLG